MRGNGQPIEFTSVADGDNHSIVVLPSVSEVWLPANYQLEGFAVLASGERHQIYLGQLIVTPDLAAAAPDVAVTTHYQRMVALLQSQLEKLAVNALQRTSVEQTEIDRVRRLDLQRQLQINVRGRQGEIAIERAKNRQPSQRKIRTVLAVMPPGFTGIRQFGAGNSVFNNDIG